MKVALATPEVRVTNAWARAGGLATRVRICRALARRPVRGRRRSTVTAARIPC